MASNVHCIVMGLSLFLLTINASPNNGPTPAQLAWQADEIGVIIHFNMVDSIKFY